MTRSIPLLILVFAAAACPKTDPGETDGTGTAGMTEPTTAATTTTTTATTTTTTTTPTTTTGDPTEPGTGTSAGTGEPWSVDACLTRFEWDCDFDEGCAAPMPVPFHACAAQMLCDPLEIKTQGNIEDYEVVETEEAAQCVLAALRDRTPGQVRIVWGDPQGFGGDAGIAIQATVTILGDDTVLMDWQWDYKTCCINRAAVSRRVLLQPAAFFDECLDMPTTESLIACFTAGSNIYDPAPDGWMPPWTLGMCDEMAALDCPAAP